MTKRKDGRWQETISINGTRKFFYGKTKQEVLRKVREYEQSEKCGMTFERVADEWYADTVRRVSPSTARGYTAAYNSAKEYMPRYVREITPPDVDTYLKRMIREKQLSHKTASNYLLVLRQILSYSVINGYAPSNPANDVSVPKGLRRGKRRAAEDAEIAKMKKLPKSDMKTFCMLAMYAGLRRGEIIALRFEDFDWNAQTISITRSASYYTQEPVIKAPKTDASMSKVPLHPELMRYFRERPKRGLVCPDPHGEVWHNSIQVKAFDRWRKENDLHFTLHQLRHYYATVLWEAGLPPDEAQVLLRHATLGMTMDVYRDIRDQKREAIFDRMKTVQF